MKYVKLMAIYASRLVLKLLWIFPIKKNRIYLTAYRGSGVKCNPMYVYKYMRKYYPGRYQYIWECGADLKEKDTIYVKPGSFKDIYYKMTSKVLVSNDGFGSFIPKKRGQMYINTWHGGGAYKTSGTDFVTGQHPVERIINRICGRQTDIFVSSSQKFTEVMSKAKEVSKKKFLECGLPRNDFLINGTKEDIDNKVRNYFKLEKDYRILLYAPTYRGVDEQARFDMQIDFSACVNAMKKRFGGKWIPLVRMHHFLDSSQIQGTIDASSYPDMQELLYVTDAFITDYSSTIWDYSLMFKPGFLFTPDLKEYASERSFYTPLETWAFPYAETNEELCSLIEEYDEDKSREKIQRHHELLGIKETGKATQIIVKKIIAFTKGR